MIRVELLEWRNPIKLVGREITLPEMGFIAKTKNRWDKRQLWALSPGFKAATIENDGNTRQSNTANHGFNLDCKFFFSATVPVSCIGFSSPARVDQQIGFYFLNLTRLDNSSSNFPTKRWNVCWNVLLLRRCNLIDIDHLSNAIFLSC